MRDEKQQDFRLENKQKQTRAISTPGKRQNKRIRTYAGILTNMKNDEKQIPAFYSFILSTANKNIGMLFCF